MCYTSLVPFSNCIAKKNIAAIFHYFELRDYNNISHRKVTTRRIEFFAKEQVKRQEYCKLQKTELNTFGSASTVLYIHVGGLPQITAIDDD